MKNGIIARIVSKDRYSITSAMSQYRFLKAVISDEQLREEIRKAKVELGLSEEQLVKVALRDLLEDIE